MTEALVVLCTTPTKEKAVEIARAVVTERLAACGNVLPAVHSVYRWEGQVQEDGEALLILKTSRARFPALRDRILKLHPYEVPEVVALPVDSGSPGYLDWL